MKNAGAPVLVLLTALLLLPVGGRALTVTAVTSDNGYPAHEVDWTDAAGLPRAAVLVDQNASGAGPYTGYLRRYTYQINGKTRVCTGTTTYDPGSMGGLETSGEGFVQNHAAILGDFSSGNGPGCPGSTAITQGSNHAIITFDMPTYSIGPNTVPTTVAWFFADGRSHPVFAVSQDSRGTAGNLGADSRSPYSDMAYDGDGVDALVGGFSYGDTYKLVTLAANPERVTNASGYRATEANTIPYAMQWAEPAAADAEMGHVATLPITLSDQGSDTRTSLYNMPPDLYDPRSRYEPAGPLPPVPAYAFQIIEYSLQGNSPTDSKRLAWGASFGRVGGFDNYGYPAGLDVTQYSRHLDDPINQPLAGSRASGLLMAYSTFIVLGPHAGGYLAGTVGKTVTQMENAANARLTATVGVPVASGPAGVGSAANAAISYTPVGYDPTFASWEVAAAGNSANVTLTPAAGAPLDHPVFVVTGYTSALLPDSLSVDGASTAGVDYYASVDSAGQRLWITVNKVVSAPVNLAVVAPTATATPTPTPTPTPSPTPMPLPMPSPAIVSVAVKGSATAIEGETKGKFLLSRTGGDPLRDLPVFFKLKGTAANGVDYQEVAESAVIPAGMPDVKVKIKPIDNGVPNPSRLVKLKLLASPAGQYTVGAGNKASIVIVDNE